MAPTETGVSWVSRDREGPHSGPVRLDPNRTRVDGTRTFPVVHTRFVGTSGLLCPYRTHGRVVDDATGVPERSGDDVVR